jgi:SAM-dependent methyltransferase
MIPGVEAKPKSQDGIRNYLQDYYGKKLKTNADLTQDACCTTDTQRQFGEVLKLIPKEVTDKHYGCGVPIPEDDLTGLRVLDLGSGSGVDVFLMAHKVGPQGFVQGIDMTDEQLETARRNAPRVMENFGYRKANVEFHRDFIEVCESIPDASVDLVISDCVINLSPRKELVFSAIHRVLKPGGEFYVSDIASDRRVPEEFKNNPELVAECLGGAEYEHDWFDQMKDAGFPDPRVFSRKVLQTELNGVRIGFSSLTVRGFKLDPVLDRRCEDYGQTAVYKGNCPGSPAQFVFDDHHLFEAHRPALVCRNTARMLGETRLSKYFEVSAPIRHFGLFDCSAPCASPAAAAAPSGACC